MSETVFIFGAGASVACGAPVMEAGLADRVFEMADLVALIEQAETPVPAAAMIP